LRLDRAARAERAREPGPPGGRARGWTGQAPLQLRRPHDRDDPHLPAVHGAGAHRRHPEHPARRRGRGPRARRVLDQHVLPGHAAALRAGHPLGLDPRLRPQHQRAGDPAAARRADLPGDVHPHLRRVPPAPQLAGRLRAGAAAHDHGAGAGLPLGAARPPDGSPGVTAARIRAWLLRGWVALVFGFLMLPVVVVALASFSRTSYLTVPPRGLTLNWFTKVLGDAEYLHAIGFSVLLALVATAGAVGAGVAASFALIRRRIPGAAVISALLNAPLIFPAVVVGVALLQFYAMVHLNGTFVALALAHMVITLPYVVRAVTASLQGIDPELEHAARVLGASGPVAFFTVTLPLIRPGVAAGALFSFIV